MADSNRSERFLNSLFPRHRKAKETEESDVPDIGTAKGAQKAGYRKAKQTEVKKTEAKQTEDIDVPAIGTTEGTQKSVYELVGVSPSAIGRWGYFADAVPSRHILESCE